MVVYGGSRRSVIKPFVFAFLSVVVAAFVVAAFVFTGAAQAGSRVRPVLSLAAPQLPESIAISPRGDMYLSLNPLREILKVTPGGTQSVFATIPAGTASLGVRLDAAGNVYVAAPGSGVWRIPDGGGTPAMIAAIPGLPNALAFDHRGNVYVSESLGGAIYRITRHGAVSVWAQSPLLVGTTGPGPCGLVHPSGLPLGANGIAFDARGDLLVNNTTLGTVVRIRARPGGHAGRASVLAGPDCRLWGADGIALDARGNLYVAANAERDIVRISPGGRLHVLASFAAGDPLFSPSDIAFGTRRGDRKQIFITNFARFTNGTGAGVVTMRVGVPGQPLP